MYSCEVERGNFWGSPAGSHAPDLPFASSEKPNFEYSAEDFSSIE